MQASWWLISPAISRATCAIKPLEPPTNNPSSRVSRRAIANAVRSATERAPPMIQTPLGSGSPKVK